MSLLRQCIYKKPPDCLVEISERVYVFDRCLSNHVMGGDEYTLYLVDVASQLQDHFLEASSSVLVSSFGEQRSQISDVLSHYNMTVMNYPCHYKSCPLLPLEIIHHFLKLSESWLAFGSYQRNVLLLHCEASAWPLLAFMLSGLMLCRKQYCQSEEKTLELVYKQAPEELLHLSSQLNPQPSQLRYLHYITTRNLASDWLPLHEPLLLDCLILRNLPHFEGFRPVLRVHGQDPRHRSILVFSTPKTKKHTHLYQQEECNLVKLDIQCHIQGDVVLECVHLHDDLVHEEMVFRIMFHTAFVSGNVLVVQRDEMDTLWDAKDQFPKEFMAEVHFSGADAVLPSTTTATVSDDSSGQFFEVEEIFSNVIDNASSHDSKGKEVWKGDVEHNVLLVSNHKYGMHAETSTDPPLPTGVREHGAPPPPPPPPPLKTVKPPPAPTPPMKRGKPPPPPPPPGYRWPRVLPPRAFYALRGRCHVFQIELRRACNIETMLTKLHMPLPDMIAAVLTMDDTVLDLDQIDNLIKFCPTMEEMEFLKHYTDHKAALGNIEKYFLELMNVPRVESKLRVFSLKIQLGSMIEEFKKRLSSVSSVCEELKEVMKEVMYNLGNKLNQETGSDSAVGFKLDSFKKLSDTHATNINMTLVHYLCKDLAYKAPVLLDLHKDLESLESALEIRMTSLAEEMQAITKGLDKLNQELTSSESDGPVSEVFRKTLKDFIPIVETQVAAVLSLYSATGVNADALSVYFGEDPLHCSFEHVTATLLSFVRSFKKAHQENIKQEELEKKKKKKAATKEENGGEMRVLDSNS